MKTAIIDTDGVLADFRSAAEVYCEEHFDTIIDSTSEEYFLIPPLEEDKQNQLVSDPDLYLDMPVFDGARAALQTLGSMDYYVIIVSARPVIAGVTLEWLTANNMYFDLLVRMSNEERIKLLIEKNADLFVHDWFENVVNAQAHCKNSFLVDQPWNRFINYDVQVINSFADVVNYIEETDVED